MKRLFNYIPSISITFTLVTLFNAIYNLSYGYTRISYKSIFGIFMLVIAISIITMLLSYLDFKTNKS